MQSIVLIGKGPSLLRCNKEFIDKYDDIAIIGYPPPTQDFLKIITGKKIKYHFCNCGDPYLINQNTEALYNDTINSQMGIEKIFDYGSGTNNYKKYIKNNIFYKENLKHKYLPEFMEKNIFDHHGPSGGIYALHHILQQKIYNKIGLIGFDNFEEGKQRYYFGVEFYQPSLQHLFAKNLITLDNKTNHKTLHSQEKTISYLDKIFKENNDMQFNLYSNIIFKNNYTNVNIF